MLAVLLATGGFAEVRGLDRRRAGGLAVIAVVGGSVPFILFFSGLAQATGPGAALIHKTLFIWVAGLAVLLLRETLGMAQVVALGALFVGVLVLGPLGAPGLGAAEVSSLLPRCCGRSKSSWRGDCSATVMSASDWQRRADGARRHRDYRFLATGRIAAIVAFTPSSGRSSPGPRCC